VGGARLVSRLTPVVDAPDPADRDEAIVGVAQAVAHIFVLDVAARRRPARYRQSLNIAE
jgi:hypothetical protein